MKSCTFARYLCVTPHFISTGKTQPQLYKNLHNKTMMCIAKWLFQTLGFHCHWGTLDGFS